MIADPSQPLSILSGLHIRSMNPSCPSLCNGLTPTRPSHKPANHTVPHHHHQSPILAQHPTSHHPYHPRSIHPHRFGHHFQPPNERSRQHGMGQMKLRGPVPQSQDSIPSQRRARRGRAWIRPRGMGKLPWRWVWKFGDGVSWERVVGTCGVNRFCGEV